MGNRFDMLGRDVRIERQRQTLVAKSLGDGEIALRGNPIGFAEIGQQVNGAGSSRRRDPIALQMSQHVVAVAPFDDTGNSCCACWHAGCHFGNPHQRMSDSNSM